MQGKLGRYAESARDYGITPAYAGKTRFFVGNIG